MPLQLSAGQQLRHRVLDRSGYALAEFRRGRGEHRDEVRPGDQPARAERWGERLAGGAEVDDQVRVEAEQGGQGGDVVAELTVVVVLDDERPGGPGPGGQRLAARDRQAAAQ